MARFNPIDFYRKAASAKPLSVAAPKTRFRPPPTAQLSTVGHLFDKAAPLIADYITAEREKEIRSADEANAIKMIKALTAPQATYDPEKYGTPPEELRAAAKGYAGYDDEQRLSDEAQREFYTEEANRVEAAYNQGDPYGAARVRQQANLGAYDMPGQTSWLAKLFGAEPTKGRMGDRSRDVMMQILLGDKEKKDAAELLSGERAYKKEVAEALATSKLAAARAKPQRRTAKVEQAESLFAARRAVIDAKTDKERATAQAVVDSLEFVIKGQDPKSVQRLEEAKLVPKHTQKGRTAWATFDSKMAPLKAMAYTVKGILYGDGTEKGKARAKSGLEYRSGYSSVVSPLAQTEAARYTQAQLTNLTSQIKQNVLQAYRLMGHTGGAVGQVSDAEQKMFANNITAMEQSQSYEDYVRSLKRIIVFVYGDGTSENIGSMNRLRAAYTKEFGSESSYFPKSGEPTPLKPLPPKPRSLKPQPGGNKPSLTDLLILYGG